MASKQTAWGVDVGATALKAIKLRRTGETVAVEAYDVVEHEKFLTDPEADKDIIIRQSLQKFLDQHNTKRDLVFISVPGSTTFARFVKLPPVEKKKIPEIVKFEAIQQIPFPLDQVNWDYQLFQAPDNPEVEAGIFAMKKDLVAGVLSNYQALKMTIHGVQMSPLAVYNCVAYDGLTAGKGTVVLDIGADHTDLIILDQGKMWLRSVNIGGNNFTDALATAFKQSFSRAENLKKTAATSKYSRQIFQAMRPIFADLVAEIQRSIGFYNSSHRDSHLERIVGIGNTFKLPNLQKYLQQNLQMEVVRLETFQKATVEGKLGAGLSEHILALGGAYGLAVQALDFASIDTNLLPMDISRQMLWREKRKWFVAAGVALAVGVGASFARYSIDASAFASNSDPKESELAKRNNAEIARADTLKKKYGSISSSYAENLTKIQALKNLSAQRDLWPRIYHDILTSLPQAKRPVDPKTPRNTWDAIFIQQLNFDYKPEITGATPTPAAAAAPGIVLDDEGNVISAPTPAAGPAKPGAGANRGFMVTFRGYTPNAGGIKFVSDFTTSLVLTAPQSDTKKPYYFELLPLTRAISGDRIRELPGMAPPWSLPNRGGFLDALLPPPEPPKPGENGAPPPPPQPMNRAVDPDTQQPMDDDFAFTLFFKVLLR